MLRDKHRAPKIEEVCFDLRDDSYTSKHNGETKPSTVQPTQTVTSIKRPAVLKGHINLVLS